MSFAIRGKIGCIVLAKMLLWSWVMPASADAKTPNEQVVCLDPGHQLYGNNALEQVAPDSKEMKAKMTSGTRGIKTKKPEYVLTLEASLLLKDKLEKLGYPVVMTRETHDVDISNVERAQKCNEAQADLAVRIHADGDNSPKAQGISLLYPASGRGTQAVTDRSKDAASIILGEAVASTGAVSRGVVPRSDLTGFNWSTVPSVLVEMGFMTNPDEDERLSDANYLNQLTEGIAAGINLALAVRADEPEVAGQSRVYLTASSNPLYELTDGRMVRGQMALSPQTVQVTAAKGSWGKVTTWAGEKWVYLGQAAIPVQDADKLADVTEDTPFYRSPSDSNPAGRLSAQQIHVLAQWNEWYLIDTWMGGMWIPAGGTMK